MSDKRKTGDREQRAPESSQDPGALLRSGVQGQESMEVRDQDEERYNQKLVAIINGGEGFQTPFKCDHSWGGGGGWEEDQRRSGGVL